MKYLVLLRGVNVGGGNRVPMKPLKSLLEESGFADVITYINSGNIILNTNEHNKLRVAEAVKQIIAGAFDVACNVLVISRQDYFAMIADAPDWWGKQEGWRHNALFVLPPTTAKEVTQAIGTPKPGIERIDVGKDIVFQSLLFKKFGETSKIVGTDLYKQLTIRNYNTVQKLCQLLI